MRKEAKASRRIIFLPQNGQHWPIGHFVKSVFIGEGQQVLSPVFKVKTGRRWRAATPKKAPCRSTSFRLLR